MPLNSVQFTFPGLSDSIVCSREKVLNNYKNKTLRVSNNSQSHLTNFLYTYKCNPNFPNSFIEGMSSPPPPHNLWFKASNNT